MKLSKKDMQEERDILEALENDELLPVAEAEKVKTEHQQAAANTFKKDARLNIRLSSRTLRVLQKMALKEIKTSSAPRINRQEIAGESPSSGKV